MTSIASTLDQSAAPGRSTGLLKSTLTVTRRALLRYLRTPQLIVLATVQMALFFLIYRYMFGGAIHITGLSYVDYLVPGFIATGVLFTGIGTAAAMAEDLEHGFIDRLRSLPIPRASVLTARASADTALVAWSTAFTAAIAFAVGFRLHGSTPLTYMVDSVRALTLGPHAHALLGHPASYFVTRALLWTVAIIAVFLPLAVAKYRRG
jgi:ABC-type multidrug transport system permease subunit